MYIYLYDIYTSPETPLKTKQLLFKLFSYQIAFYKTLLLNIFK